jgi:hypothetical protein
MIEFASAEAVIAFQAGIWTLGSPKTQAVQGLVRERRDAE